MAATANRRPPALRAEIEDFARRLTGAMAARGFSQSDLARAIWGGTLDARGQDVARNRDRISNYCRGNSMPEMKTLKAIADALGMTVSELNPAVARTAPPAYSFTVVGGRPDLALLSVQTVVPTRIAAQVVTLLAAVTDVDTGRTAPAASVAMSA